MTFSINILLVEDSLAQARLLQEMCKDCEPEQYTLVQVQRLQEALAQLCQESFDVILLDLNLPDSQGLTSLEQLLRASEVPVVVLSNTNDQQLAQATKQLGARDYLVKRQITPQLLVQVLRRVVADIPT